MSLESKRLKKSSSNYSVSALIYTATENAIFVFPVLPGIVQKQKLFEVA